MFGSLRLGKRIKSKGELLQQTNGVNLSFSTRTKRGSHRNSRPPFATDLALQQQLMMILVKSDWRNSHSLQYTRQKRSLVAADYLLACHSR
jgi:hypothetical protein